MKGIIGVDVGGTNIKSALVFGNKIKERIKLPTHGQTRVEKTVEQIKASIRPFIKNAQCIGIGIAGIIDSKNGIVKYSPNLKGWENIPLAKILNKEFNVRIKVLNDVNAVCLGEWKYGVAKGHDNVFLFTLGTGIGGAAICEGKLLFGANGFAGEPGHTIINLKGPKCRCGHHGHVERYAGARYIVARTRRRMKKKKSRLINYKKLTPEIIAQEAKRGDIVAIEVFSEIGYYIGIAVANILAMFDPDIIVISGGIARAGKILFEPIRRATAQMTYGEKYRNYNIVPAQLGDDAGILGAAHFAQLTGV